jgi:ectoine hydroxylase-related dioxygenase (phytanoyl-CoA dioxygenase family)
VDELVDSAPLLGDWAALRRRIHDDGYVFVRGLLDAELVRNVGRDCLTRLQRAGWSESGDALTARPRAPARATNVRESFRDRGYRRMMMQDGVNQLPYLGPFADLMHQVMGPAAFVYPLKLVRVVYPTSVVPQQPGGTVHKDYVAVQDMFTTWVPLVDVPAGLGGLAVRAGTQRHAAFLPREMNPDEPGWSTTDYRPGDVLVFHCLTSHAALPNRSERFRISAEYRWQLADDPAPRALVLNKRGREIGSRFFARRPWWRPVPAGLQFRDGGLDTTRERSWPPAPSRFVEFQVP